MCRYFPTGSKSRPRTNPTLLPLCMRHPQRLGSAHKHQLEAIPESGSLASFARIRKPDSSQASAGTNGHHPPAVAAYCIGYIDPSTSSGPGLWYCLFTAVLMLTHSYFMISVFSAYVRRHFSIRCLPTLISCSVLCTLRRSVISYSSIARTYSEPSSTRRHPDFRHCLFCTTMATLLAPFNNAMKLGSGLSPDLLALIKYGFLLNVLRIQLFYPRTLCRSRSCCS